MLNAALLFLAALGGGLLAMRWQSKRDINFKGSLIFSGAYIFSITVVHILPETFHEHASFVQTGAWVLVGFYMQLILAFFSHGLEHGHSHAHMSDKSGLVLVIALLLHSVIEGAMLGHPHQGHDSHALGGILLGIILHKVPAAYALVSILGTSKNKNRIWFGLIIFALGSPLGMAISGIMDNQGWFGHDGRSILFAIVAGNFLHISTSIFFESNPTHKFGMKKLVLSILGALMGILTESL